MRISSSSTSPEPAFNPVTINLTFESQRELDTFGSLFNFTAVADALREVGGLRPNAIAQEVVNLGGVISKKELYAIATSIRAHCSK